MSGHGQAESDGVRGLQGMAVGTHFRFLSQGYASYAFGIGFGPPKFLNFFSVWFVSFETPITGDLRAFIFVLLFFLLTSV